MVFTIVQSCCYELFMEGVSGAELPTIYLVISCRALRLSGLHWHAQEDSRKVTPPRPGAFSYEICLACGAAFVASWTVGAWALGISRYQKNSIKLIRGCKKAAVPRAQRSAKACLPMLADLAPWGRKSGILAWQGALEGAFGCLVTSSMDVPGQHFQPCRSELQLLQFMACS